MTAAAPAPKDNQGRPLPRIDARLKVTGEAMFAADEPVADLAHAVLVTSDIARGRVEAFHLDDARAVPGVIGILTQGDMDGVGRPSFGLGSYTSLGPLHETTVHHDGQIVALVVAETLEAAREAAFRVRIDYAEEPASASIGSDGAETVEAKGNAPMVKDYPKAGDFASAFAGAAVTFEAEYSTPTQHHNPMELFSTTAAWHGDQLTVWEPSQNVFGFRGAIAAQLQMDPGKVRVISRYVGGGFGSKGPGTPRSAIVAHAARKFGRPVRCVVSREQGFTTMPYRAPTRHRIRLGADHDGTIVAFGHEGWELTSRLDGYAVAGVDATAKLYGFETIETRVNLVRADRQTPGFMRSPPEVPYVFALETALDELAEKLDIDPVELRRINDTMTDPVSGKPFSSRSLMACYDAAAEAFGWARRDKAPKSMREGDWLIGYGCATAVYPTNIAAAAARVTLYADGRARVQSASHEIGTGIRTVAGQMAAEELGLDLDRVEVEMGDTELPPAPVAGGSNSTASICSAVLEACRRIRGRLAEAAVAAKEGPLAGKRADQLSLRGGALVARDGTVQALGDVFDTLGRAVVEEYVEFVPEGAPENGVRMLHEGGTPFASSAKRPFLTHAYGAEFVEVRINARTREIRVPRMVGAFAAGRIMNTRTAHSQLMGGLIWGMSAGLFEETEVDERSARYVNREIAEYLMPVNADVGEVEVIMLPEVDDKANPAGVKGLGELGNVGTNAAIVNAVYHATGVRIRDLPVRIEKLLG